MESSRGFSTIELLLALGIMSTTVAAIVLVTIGLPEAVADGHAEERAASTASQLLEKHLLLGIDSFSSVASLASSTTDGYTSSLLVTTLPDGLTKELLSTTGWINERGVQKYVEFFGRVTDYKNAAGNTCSSVLAGDWTHPLVSTETLVPGSALPLGSARIPHPISAIATGTSTLAVAVTSAINKTDPTLFLFDTSSSTAPLYLGSLDNASSTRSGFAALAEQDTASNPYSSLVYGATAYGAAYTTCSQSVVCSQLQIIDTTNTANPAVIENFQLPTSTPPFAIGSGGQSAGKSIFYANGLVYLGLQKTGSAQGDEFNIVNVQNPRAPVWLGGYSIGRTVNQMEVADGLAYLATDDPSRELVILDVHDPTHVSLVGTYDAPGSTTFGFGEAVALASSTLALGRSYSYNAPEFALLNIASATTPTLMSAENTNTGNQTDSVVHIVIRSFLAFVLTTSQLQLWNITDPAQPRPYAPVISLPDKSTGTGTAALACQNNTLFVASSDANHAGYLTTITGS